MTEVTATSEISTRLVRYMARKMAGLLPDDWRALSEEKKKPHVDRARTFLKSERNFLARAKEDDED